MSILSSTNSGIHQPITYDYLVQQGYLVSETHAIKICNNGAKYELSKYNGDTVYKAHIIGEFTKNFSVSYHVYRENYTFFIKTINDLKMMEKYWDDPNPKNLYDVIHTVENTCSISYKS
jgi:hypothetical protein